jgi:4-amino-4-deoxy-L-arabinose transferase-like glycosyltransferase
MPTRSHGLLIAALAAVVLLPNVGGPPLWDDDEPRNAACSLAMHATGDWIVPTFNGRLRVEKPVLVNWLHLAGFAVAGVNETGARLGSALLTIATCLLTWRIGAAVFTPTAGCWAGIVMATCLWTGVGGRAATPDPPLVFCTTLALWLFVRGGRLPDREGAGWRSGPVRLSAGSAAAVGAALGLAVLAKGPVGLVPPMAAFVLFAWWQAGLDPNRSGSRAARLVAGAAAAWRGVRPLVILAAALVVAGPWYAAVGWRTDGAWLRGFFLVHNVGRFAAPMEGHSGSPLLYYPLVVLIGTFPWSMAAALVARHGWRSARGAGDAAVGGRLLVVWTAAWLVPLSLSATKLPGYAWPAYPAIACLAGLFFADWVRLPAIATDRWMRLAWGLLAASGLALAAGLPLVAARFAPGAEWLGCIGLLPLAGAAIAWACQSLHSRLAASAALAATACATVALLVSVGPAALGRSGGTRQLVARLAAINAGGPIAAYRAPPSTAFYAGRLRPAGSIADLQAPAEVVDFLDTHPGAHLVIDARFEEELGPALPPHYRVLHAATTLPESRRILLVGPAAADGRPDCLADANRPPHR